MSAHGQASGRTGFLFGNIDRQGRLDEDYLSDDAKDTLDHIGTKVTEKDRELHEIREALPGDNSIPPPPSAPPPQPEPERDEFYEDDVEDDPLDDDHLDQFDHAQRLQLANRALAAPRPAPSPDEEDYDEDDGDAPSTKPQSIPSAPPHPVHVAPPSFVPVPVPSPTTTSVASVAHALFPSQPLGHPPPVPLPSPAPPSHLYPSSAHALPSPPQPAPSSPPRDPRQSDRDDDPILFSHIFARSPKPLRFGRRPRRALGLKVVSHHNPPPSADDTESLNRAPSPPILDPVALALKHDDHHRKLLFPPAPEIRPRKIHLSDAPQDKLAAASLSSPHSPDRSPRTPPNGPALVSPPVPFQLLSWEKNIMWNDDTDGNASADNWCSDDDSLSNNPNSQDPPSAPKSSVSPQDASANVGDSDDADSDDFEDPVDFQANPQPTDSQPSSSLEPRSEEKGQSLPNDDDDDDDDDMEWEDGAVSQPTNPPENPASDAPLPVAKPTAAPPVLSRPQTPRKDQIEPVAPNPSNGPAPQAGDPHDGINQKLTNSSPVQQDSQAPVPSSSGAKESHDRLDDEGDLVKSIIAPNADLSSGSWSKAIMWDSENESDDGGKSSEMLPKVWKDINHRLSCLILDMNDPNMIFERISEDHSDDVVDQQSIIPSSTGALTTEKMKMLISTSGPQLKQLLQTDSYNISNDVFYVTSAAQHLKLDRVSIIRGLQNAPPASKIQTTSSALSDAELLSFRRPKLSADKLPKDVDVVALRRKRVKGGNAQIAGQIPKRKAELRCSEKDAYRVSVFEYALERQPCILPIPGMASRVCTYARKESGEAVQRAVNAAAGTADADTIFMGPDEPPPLAAGNVEAGDKPLSIVESQVYIAPCAKVETAPTDFLLVRHGKNMVLREIDSLISIGMTEPKVEVMTPNTERYKKYSRERMVLWVMREFQRMAKDIEKRKKDRNKDDGDAKALLLRDPPYIEKDEIYSEFPRRRTYPETGLLRALKELSRFQNGKYVQDKEVAMKYSGREQELLRIITPTETASFESMESAWGQILDRGIFNFTLPSVQGNILAAAEADRSGLEAGPSVGKYIKTHLLKTPWYRSVNMIAAYRVQRKDLLQALSLARIVNDLKEGGEVMEAKLLTLTPAEMNNVLTQVYRFNSKKVPLHPEERRVLIRELCLKKAKGASAPEVSDYPTIIRNVLKKNRDTGLSKGATIAAMGTLMAGGTFLGLPLPVQRKALEDGEVGGLPAEEDDFVPDDSAEDVLAAYKRSAAARNAANSAKKSGEESRKSTDEGDAGNKRNGKKGRPPGSGNQIKEVISLDTGSSGEPGVASKVEMGVNSKNSSENTAREKGLQGDAGDGIVVKKKSQDSKDDSKDGDETKKQPKKKVKRLKLTKRVTGEDGKEKAIVTYVSDPKEIERLLERRNRGKNNSCSISKKSADEPNGGESRLKLKLALTRLQGGKAGLMKKKNVAPGEKGKGKGKGGPKESNDREKVVPQKKPEKKGQIGKIKINTKQLTIDKEQAALKRKRSQYSDDIDYRAKKAAKTSRKKRNGRVELNGILERIENVIRNTEGYVVPTADVMTIARLKEGESPPPRTEAKKLASPEGTGLDFTAPVDTKQVPHYKDIVKKPMYLNLIRSNCKQMTYEKGSDFIEDVKLMVSNARAFNSGPKVQWVVQHAELLLEVAVEQVSRKMDEIRTAEAMVTVEKTEAHSGGAGKHAKNKGNKGKSKGKGGDGKKGMGKKKKPIKDTITIGEDEKEVIDLSGGNGGGDIYEANGTNGKGVGVGVSCGGDVVDVDDVDGGVG